MQQNEVFSAKQWIAANVVSAEQLKPETLAAAESFTLMWDVFEGLVCDNSATISRLEKLSVEIVARRRRQAVIERIFKHLQNRYYTGTAFTVHFDGLGLRASDRKAFIEAALRDEKTDYGSKVLALLFILYRVRTSLFHGPGALGRLNSLAPTLQVACRALATIIEAHGRHFKRERYAGQPTR